MGLNNHRNGFSLPTATIFIIGEVAGAGILSLPHAVSQASWYGLPMIMYSAFCAGFSGFYLAKCWIILEDRYPQYREGLSRKPFATIGHHAFGSYMGVFVSIIMNITRIGATTVFILLTSNLLISLTQSFIYLNICQWAPIVSVLFWIPMFLGSPIDFWPIAYLAVSSTIIGSIILIASLIIQINKNGFSHNYQFDGFKNFSAAFGTTIYAFGGASAFPNFQNGMRNKNQFSKAVIFATLGLLLLYLPTAGLGYAAFGHKTDFNVIKNFDIQSERILKILTDIMQTCFLIHCCAVVSIVINPVFLDLEELMNIPKPFNWKRLLFRTALLIFMTLLGETFPNFGQILDLIGGSFVAIMTFVLPPIFYLKLCSNSEGKNNRIISMFLKIIFIIIIASGLAGGIACTYSTLSQWIPLETACWINLNKTQRS